MQRGVQARFQGANVAATPGVAEGAGERMKTPSLHDLMRHHEPHMRRLAEQHGLGALQARGYEGNPRDAVRTAIVTYRFARGVITYDSTAGVDYRVEKPA